MPRRDARMRAVARVERPARSLPLWITVGALAWVQWLVSSASAHQIRYEELAESVRNVFWLDERLVYDGISSNVGWYGLLLLTYKLFGFSLISAKVVRLGLHTAALSAIALLIRRRIPGLAAIVPLAVVGLSPAVLYFNSLQTSFGVDISYAAVALLLVISVRAEAPRRLDLVKSFGAGMVVAIAAMSYPTFLAYVPSLVLVWLWATRWRAGTRFSARWQALHGAAWLAGIAAPVAFFAWFLSTPGLLIHDAVTGAGLFRGGGGGIAWQWSSIWAAMSVVSRDLFIEGRSYYLELQRPDFSGAIGAIGAVVITGSFLSLAIAGRIDRPIAAAVALLAVFSLTLPGLSAAGPPGLRRATGVLAAFFCAFAIVWHYWLRRATPGISRVVALGACLLVPVGLAFKAPSLHRDVRNKSMFRNADWFAIERTPAASLDTLRAAVADDQPLRCPSTNDGRVVPCRFQEAYAALAGWHRWNDGSDRAIAAVDWKTGRRVVLSTALWVSYYYPH